MPYPALSPVALPCSKLYVWNWNEHTLRQTIELGADGAIPLETRFAHEPSATWGFVVSCNGAQALCLRDLVFFWVKGRVNGPDPGSYYSVLGRWGRGSFGVGADQQQQ